MLNKILSKIKEYDNITIFRHLKPDGDCMFSAYALYLFLKDNFKDKNIKVTGFERYDLINKIDKVSNTFIKNSLAIVLDTANTTRIDDKRLNEAKFIIKIDHHPALQNYGDINYVNDKAGATCEILGSIFLSKTFSKYQLSKKVCEYLYCGILTDTLNFKTNSCTADTLLIASKLAQKGELNISKLSSFCFSKNLHDYKLESRLREMLIVDKKYGYILLNKKQLDRLGIDSNFAKDNVECIGSISDLNVWGVIAYNHKTKLFDASIRSNSGYVINDVAAEYNGGGHKCAAGIKSLTLKQVKELNNKLAYISNK